MNQRQLGASHSDLPSRETDSSPKSPSPTKPPPTDLARVFHRAEKGRQVDLLVSNIERESPAGHVLTNHSENKTNSNKANDLHSFEGKSILKRLQESRSPPSSNGKPKKFETTTNAEPVKSPTTLSPKYSISVVMLSAYVIMSVCFLCLRRYQVQSGVGVRGLNAYKDPGYPTLQSRSDEYKKKLQGMSKKVGEVFNW